MNSADYIQTLNAVRPTRRVAILAAASVVLAGLVQALPPPVAAGLNAEDGPLEFASACLLGVAVLVGLIAAVRRPSLLRIAGFLVLAALLCRELDFQKRFTYRSIESVGFYTRPIATGTEKLAAASVLFVLALAGIAVFAAAARRLPQAMREREGWVGSVAAAFGLLGSSLACEKLLGFTVAEEALELGFAGVVLITAWQTAGFHPAAERGGASESIATVHPFEAGASARTAETAGDTRRAA